MVCIYCAHPLSVTNSRRQHHANQVWRRRFCSNCQALFTTHEAIDLATSLMVKRVDGSLAPFVRDRLFISVYKSCGHKGAAIDVARALTATIIQKAMQHASSGVITTKQLAVTSLTSLSDFDAAAGVQYEAYHAQTLA